jgi:hypothetical protein
MTRRPPPTISSDWPGQHPLLVRAFEEHRPLALCYKDKPRKIEPQCYGLSWDDIESVRVHLPLEQGPDKIFHVAKMQDLRLLDEHFRKPSPFYKPDDSAFRVIFRQLDRAPWP